MSRLDFVVGCWMMIGPSIAIFAMYFSEGDLALILVGFAALLPFLLGIPGSLAMMALEAEHFHRVERPEVVRYTDAGNAASWAVVFVPGASAVIVTPLVAWQAGPYALLPASFGFAFLVAAGCSRLQPAVELVVGLHEVRLHRTWIGGRRTACLSHDALLDAWVLHLTPWSGQLVLWDPERRCRLSGPRGTIDDFRAIRRDVEGVAHARPPADPVALQALQALRAGAVGPLGLVSGAEVASSLRDAEVLRGRHSRGSQRRTAVSGRAPPARPRWDHPDRPRSLRSPLLCEPPLRPLRTSASMLSDPGIRTGMDVFSISGKTRGQR